MEIRNGSTVHRFWKTLDDAELIAVFQYDNYAETFCKAAINHCPDGTMLVYVCHYSGKMQIFRKPEDAKGAE